MKVRLSLFSAIELEGHLLVTGPTGSGKTNTVKVILEEISSKLPVLVLDYHGEYNLGRVLTPGINLRFSMFSDNSDPEFIVDVLGTLFQLTEPQWYIILRSVRKLGSGITLKKLVEAVEEEPANDWRTYEIKQAVLRRLAILSEGLLGEVLNGVESPEFLFEEVVTVNLSVLPPRYRSFLALIIMKHLYDHACRRGESKRIVHVTVLEEAWNVLLPRARWEPPSIGERLFLELRKFGELVIAVSQRVDDISERSTRNCAAIIMHQPSEIELERLGCRVDQGRLGKLQRRGTALVVKTGCSLREVRVRKAKS
ncbi:MAG: DUF87 domain-containing protein [Thermofilum sp.]